MLVRQREEVQEMPRRYLAIGLLALARLSAEIWHGVPAKAVEAPGNPAIWKEFGLKSAEQANFGARKIVAYEMQDVTGAVAASDWLRSGETKAVSVGRVVLACDRCALKPGDYAKNLPTVSRTSAPTLPSYLPRGGAVAGSERYILGPAGLAEFAPAIPPTLVGFHLSPEADLMRYQTPAGEATLAVFSYPTPQIARQQADGFRKLSGAFVKRSGPLVAIALGITDKNAAWGLLNQVSYEAEVTLNETAKRNQAKGIANMILSIFALAGILIGICLGTGLLFAFGRLGLKHFGIIDAHEAMTTLHLSDS